MRALRARVHGQNRERDMVARTFRAYDNDVMQIDAASPFGTAGNPIINNSDTPNGTIFTFSGTNRKIDVTVNDTQGGSNVFNDDQPNGHRILDGGGIVGTNARVEAESVMFFRQIDASGNPVGGPIRVTVFSQNGQTQNVWGFAADQPLIPGARYVKQTGSNTGTSNYSDLVICFASGTRLRTPTGPRLIDALRPGDPVWTIGDPARPVRWISSRRVPAAGALAPIRFAPGAIGNENALMVSPQHRIARDGAGIELLFGAPRVLVAAKHLLGRPGVSQPRMDSITYVHVMFDAHCLVEAEGVLSESFFAGPQAVAALDAEAQAELVAIFPELGKGGDTPLAAPELSAREASLLG